MVGSNDGNNVPPIDHFDVGTIKINGVTYNDDVIICPDKLLTNWDRSHPLKLGINDLQMVISERPALMIIGSGQEQTLQIDNFTQTKLNDLGFDVYIAKTRQAISKYNKERKNRKTVGIFHIS